jgi:acetyltransferase-like isoleucine patch superfamily enzyme
VTIVGRLSRNKLVEVVLTLLVYSLYTAVLAASLAPSAWILIGAARTVLPQLSAGPIGGALIALTCLALSAAVYAYVIWGVVLQAVVIRLLSLGLRPGRYPAASLTTLRWLVYSGIYTLGKATILPLVPATCFANLYFRLVGCRIGRNVKINTSALNDAYLLELEDDVLVGGATDLSCHTYEDGFLVLAPIRIGAGTVVGAHCYVSPGVTVGRRCVIGLGCYLRPGTKVPDDTILTSAAALDPGIARRIETGRF